MILGRKWMAVVSTPAVLLFVCLALSCKGGKNNETPLQGKMQGQSADQVVVERVTGQLVDLLSDDSKIASLKIKRLLELMPENFDYSSSKILLKARQRVLAYELDRIFEDMPTKPKKPVSWCQGALGIETGPCKICYPDYDRTGTEKFSIPGPHQCIMKLNETFLNYADGSVERYELFAPIRNDSNQPYEDLMHNLRAANDVFLRKRQDQADGEIQKYEEVLAKKVPAIKGFLKELQQLDTERTYEEIRNRAQQFLSSISSSEVK